MKVIISKRWLKKGCWPLRESGFLSFSLEEGKEFPLIKMKLITRRTEWDDDSPREVYVGLGDPFKSRKTEGKTSRRKAKKILRKRGSPEIIAEQKRLKKAIMHLNKFRNP